MVAAELTAVVIALVLIACGVGLGVAFGVAITLGAVMCLVEIRDLTPWQWALRLARWTRRRTHRITDTPKIDNAKSLSLDDVEDAADQPDSDPAEQRRVEARTDRFSDVHVDGERTGVLIDGHTVVTMVALWGKPYMPTLLKPDSAQTPNTVPLSVIAAEMNRAGLGVDVDIVAEGRRTSNDSYSEAFAAFLRRRAAVGQRTATMVIRLDTHAADTTAGLLWRPNTVAAAIAATQRIVKALRQANCRAEILTAAQMRESTAASVGGPEVLAAAYADRWTALHQPGHGYTTGFYLPAKQLTAEALEDVWAIEADHTCLVVALRRRAAGVRVGATVRYTTARPMRTNPADTLRRFSGRQWESLARTIPGADRLADLPTTPLGTDLDEVVGVGPSGALIGGVRDGMVLMPLSDPAQPTRIAVNASDLVVRQLIRRATASGELVAVYDEQGRWTMSAGSSRIWTTRNPAAQPARPPTMVVHHGRTNPYPGAPISVAVGVRNGYDPDIQIEQRGRTLLHLRTKRFSVDLEAVTFPAEQAYLN
ncbi:hypothetical protein AFM11_30315 [Mycolicibacterium wolinskyi]|uniref:Type VII secretion system protein EccE domain-containing protein n=1 Tax=Mycolicibacterium wolinskyi TaxID=59750 RepID=A0A132PDR5_9MYCO|nr:type VII secretion protein EccE [Mycolicibacterium wolinskyi]KWX20470.1 hypothetical protein AFM11_30315 [Mycolicibacterium wolinskyi]